MSFFCILFFDGFVDLSHLSVAKMLLVWLLATFIAIMICTIFPPFRVEILTSQANIFFLDLD